MSVLYSLVLTENSLVLFSCRSAFSITHSGCCDVQSSTLRPSSPQPPPLSAAKLPSGKCSQLLRTSLPKVSPAKEQQLQGGEGRWYKGPARSPLQDGLSPGTPEGSAKRCRNSIALERCITAAFCLVLLPSLTDRCCSPEKFLVNFPHASL